MTRWSSVMVAAWLVAGTAFARPRHAQAPLDWNDPDLNRAGGHVGQVEFQAVVSPQCMEWGQCRMEVAVHNGSDHPVWVLLPDEAVHSRAAAEEEPSAIFADWAEWRGPAPGQPILVNFFSGRLVGDWKGPYAFRLGAGTGVRVHTDLIVNCALTRCPRFLWIPLAIAQSIDFAGAELFLPDGGPTTWTQSGAMLNWSAWETLFRHGESHPVERRGVVSDEYVPHTIHMVGAESVSLKMRWRKPPIGAMHDSHSRPPPDERQKSDE